VDLLYNKSTTNQSNEVWALNIAREVGLFVTTLHGDNDIEQKTQTYWSIRQQKFTHLAP